MQLVGPRQTITKSPELCHFRFIIDPAPLPAETLIGQIEAALDQSVVVNEPSIEDGNVVLDLVDVETVHWLLVQLGALPELAALLSEQLDWLRRVGTMKVTRWQCMDGDNVLATELDEVDALVLARIGDLVAVLIDQDDYLGLCGKATRAYDGEYRIIQQWWDDRNHTAFLMFERGVDREAAEELLAAY